MSFIKHAIIAAAGLGSRLGMGKPKCLMEIAGTPLIGHQLLLLKDVEDVRIVVGFEEAQVIQTVLEIRRDVVFVRNPSFRTTTTLDSYALGARYLKEPALYLDADIFFERKSFAIFLQACASQPKAFSPIVAVTKSKTYDAVYTKLDCNDQILAFSRDQTFPYEWANLVFAPANYFEGGSGAVFEHLNKSLPLNAYKVVSYEIDRPEELITARLFAENQLKKHALETTLL